MDMSDTNCCSMGELAEYWRISNGKEAGDSSRHPRACLVDICRVTLNVRGFAVSHADRGRKEFDLRLSWKGNPDCGQDAPGRVKPLLNLSAKVAPN